MTNREEFEKYLNASGLSYRHDVALSAWQACAELKDKRIAELEEQLRIAKDWSEHYRKQCVEAASQEPVLFVSPRTVELARRGVRHAGINTSPRMDEEDRLTIPLYALPAIRELSDEEIRSESGLLSVGYSEEFGERCVCGEVEFARAILAKARGE